jgi:hypothetical protein
VSGLPHTLPVRNFATTTPLLKLQKWRPNIGVFPSQVILRSNQNLRLYSKRSHTLNEWRFNMSFSWVSVLFLNSWRVSVVPYNVTTHPPATQKQHWHSRKVQIEPPLIERKCKWAFRIRAL